MGKEELRNKYRKIRLAMGRTEIEAKSRIISGKLLTSVDWPNIKRLHIYKSIAELNEVATQPVIETVSQKWPHLAISIAGTARNETLPTDKYDLIVVPMLAFDKGNYRLGFGSGWYDRFLATQPQALKIGLAFQNGFVPDGLSHEPHDIPLNKVITEI